MKVLISSSMRHADKFASLAAELEQLGYKTVLPAVSGGYSKREYIDMHMNNLRKADALLIANFDDDRGDGYIGASCFFEAGWAFALDKPVYVLNPIHSESAYKEDLDAIGVTLLKEAQ